ncbi:MAG: DUF4854 domain-containing protein [Clostridia bacterium]|nr:DUF4854 domain-containing protein [Clostridia bacterium]
MKHIKKLLALALTALMVVSLTACFDTTMTMEEHFEKNKAVYENVSNTENGTVKYSVRGNSLVLTGTVPNEVDDKFLETYRSTFEQSVENSDSTYMEILENVREDVPDATFIVEFVDKNGKTLYSKEYK